MFQLFILSIHSPFSNSYSIFIPRIFLPSWKKKISMNYIFKKSQQPYLHLQYRKDQHSCIEFLIICVFSIVSLFLTYRLLQIAMGVSKIFHGLWIWPVAFYCWWFSIHRVKIYFTILLLYNQVCKAQDACWTLICSCSCQIIFSLLFATFPTPNDQQCSLSYIVFQIQLMYFYSHHFKEEINFIFSIKL